MKTNIKTSKYRGVCWDKSRNKWIAQIGFEGRSFTLGRFQDETLAARAYNRAALRRFGEDAVLNSFDSAEI